MENQETEIFAALEKRHGKSAVKHLNPRTETDFPLLMIELQERSKIQVLMTNGLSNYKMPVTEKYVGKEFTELYFCLPSYWDLEDETNPNFNWVWTWIQRLTHFVLEKQTWFGVGHTIPAGNPPAPLSATMKQNHFFFSAPVFLQHSLKPLKISEKEVHFLAIIPIFEDEMDFKLGKGTFKFQRKLAQQNITELLDDYRMTALRNKWRFFRR